MVNCRLPKRLTFYKKIGKKKQKNIDTTKKVLDCSQKIFLNKSSLMNRKHYVKRKTKSRDCD